MKMIDRQELYKILDEMSADLDKNYFKVSAKKRDTIARLVMIKDLLETLPFDKGLEELEMYSDFITTKINYFQSQENYEAADFYKRIKKQINNMNYSQLYI